MIDRAGRTPPIGDRRGTRGDGRFWDPRSRARSIDLSRTPPSRGPGRRAPAGPQFQTRARTRTHAAAPWRPASAPCSRSSSSVTRGTQIPPSLFRRFAASRVSSVLREDGRGNTFFRPHPRARSRVSSRGRAPTPSRVSRRVVSAALSRLSYFSVLSGFHISVHACTAVPSRPASGLSSYVST